MILEVIKAINSEKPVLIDTVIALDNQLLSDRMVTHIGECKVNGSYRMKNSEQMQVSAHCEVEVAGNCEVCCNAYTKHLAFDINQIVSLKKNEELAYEVQNGVVDLKTIVMDEFLLLLPSRLLCKDNCELESNEQK